MQNNKVRFGIIGYGAIGPRHKEKIDHIKEAELTAVCDLDEKRFESFNGNGIRIFKDYKEMINLKEIDVVSICTPNYLHAEMATDALRQGKHVLCEKPMAITSQDCKLMVHTALRENRKLFIVKQNRYNPPVMAVKKLIEEKRLGRIFYIVTNCFWNRNNAYYQGSPWKGKRKLDGGALFTQFSHFIDLMLFFGGNVESVYHVAANFNHPDIEIEDTGTLNIKFSEGIIGTVNYTNNAYQKNMEGSITIFAEKGTIKIGGQYLNELEYQITENGKIETVEISGKPNDYGTYQGSMSNHDKVYENVVDSLTNGGKVAVSGIEGMWTTEVIEAAYRSLETGTVIRV